MWIKVDDGDDGVIFPVGESCREVRRKGKNVVITGVVDGEITELLKCWVCASDRVERGDQGCNTDLAGP